MKLGIAGLILAGLAFVAEAAISAARGRPLHRWTDSLSALSLSLLTGLVAPFGKAFLFLLYIPLQANLALREWQGDVADWVMAVLAYEFFGYWFHRFSHRTNLGWAVHIAHHQSEELNLSTALRTAPLRSLLDWPTLLPMALLGIPPHAMVLLYIQHVAGQYWLHIQWVRSLGPLEWVLNTPSHHRVHHGCDEGYQDANYGASLIIWDRLFGTFVPETHAATYGVTRPVPGWDPFRATFYPFWQVWDDAREWSTWDRMRVWLMPPGWKPDGSVAKRSPPARRNAAPPRRLYQAIWHFVTASLLLMTVPQASFLSWPARLAMAFAGLWAVRVFGLVLEDKAVARVEHVGVAVSLLVTAALLPEPGAVAVACMAAGELALALRPRGARAASPR
ncbi:MAG: fatty acid hydroxylase family protein [Deltaproteobacteria bacterium]|nr:MAG: fatty acid hydroxylase family protein [Deltaproteobacteria bacterium]